MVNPKISLLKDFDEACHLFLKSFEKPLRPEIIRSIVEDDQSLILAGAFGGIIANIKPPRLDICQITTLFLCHDGRGSWGKSMLIEAFSWIFQNTEAQKILAKAQDDTFDRIRLTYPPDGGNFRVIVGGRGVGEWTYLKEDWKY